MVPPGNKMVLSGVHDHLLPSDSVVQGAAGKTPVVMRKPVPERSGATVALIAKHQHTIALPEGIYRKPA
jgi:glutathionylspermidine synthase